MAVNIEDFDGNLMSKLFPQAWPQMKLLVPVKEKAGDKTDPTSKSEASSPELFSLQEEKAVTNRYPMQSGHEAMTVATTDGQSEQSKPEQNPVPAKREGLSEMPTPESTSFKLTEVEDKPATAQPIAGDGGSTLYQTRHRVKRTSGRIEIIEGGEPLPEGQHPRDFDELLVFMDEQAITVEATSDGLVFTGGTEASRERVIACLNADIWLECNLRRYLDGSLRDIDGQKYVHPKLR